MIDGAGVVDGVVRNVRDVVANEFVVDWEVAEVGISCSGVCIRSRSRLSHFSRVRMEYEAIGQWNEWKEGNMKMVMNMNVEGFLFYLIEKDIPDGISNAGRRSGGEFVTSFSLDFLPPSAVHNCSSDSRGRFLSRSFVTSSLPDSLSRSRSPLSFDFFFFSLRVIL